MNRIMRILGIAAMVGMTATCVFAGGQAIAIDNTSNDPAIYGGTYGGSTALWNSPTAVSHGALWIDTGSGPTQVQSPDVNFELDCLAPNGSGGYAWQPVVTLLLSIPYGTDYANSGYAADDVSDWGLYDPGAFMDDSGTNWQIPNTSNENGPDSGYWMRLSCWTGTDNTLAAAVADHAYVGETPEFYQLFGYATPPPFPATLTAMPALVLRQSLPGDANLDGTVDINDLTIVLAHYNQTGMTWTTGDFTGDGTVDINDLTIVLAHFNDSAGSSAAGSVSAAPEPGTLVLLAAAVAALLAYARRRW